MSTANRLGIVLLLAVFASAALPGQGRDGDRRPNFLFLFADDQRADAISAHGNRHIRTPSLDRLAARGFSFRANYCMGSIHGAVCQPSRAMLHSGQTLFRVRMDLQGSTLLTEHLRAHGYATFATGKWHNGRASFLRAFAAGESVFFGGMSNHLAVPVSDLLPDGKLSRTRTERRFSSELFADRVIAFLERQPTDGPFFAYVSFTAPHDPRQPPEPIRSKYYDARPPLPPNFLPQHPFRNGWLTCRDERLAAWPRTEAIIRDQLAEYYGMITHLDLQVGRILAALESTGHAENTIIIYSADHGLAMGSHGLLGKQSLYEHSMGCPLIFVGPNIPKGSTRAPTYLLDLYPTVCELAGVPVPPEVEGKSLRSLWETQSATVRDSLFTAFDDKMRAVRDARWKLIRYPKIGYTQLFDLAADSHEMRNLAEEPAHARRVERMLTLLEAWQERTDDPHPLEVTPVEPREVDLSGRLRKPDRCQPEWIVKKYFR